MLEERGKKKRVTFVSDAKKMWSYQKMWSIPENVEYTRKCGVYQKTFYF
jgi:hypothetical protein